MLDHLRFDRIEPGTFGFAQVGQQAIAFAQRGVVARGMAGMRRVERKCEPVHVPAPVASRASEDPVHRRREPRYCHPFAKAGGTAVGAVDPHPAPRGQGAVGVGRQPDGLILLLAQAGPDPETGLAAAAHQIGQRRAAQPAPWRKQRQRFENIGLSCAVFTNQQVELRGRFQLGRGMIAEVGKGDAIERHGSPAR